MLYSMTGYGRIVQEFEERTITVEIRSLNSKYLDVKPKLPQSYREKELDIRRIVGEKLRRGKIDILLEVRSVAGDNEFVLNRDVFKNYFHELQSVSEELNMPVGDFLPAIVRLPNVVSSTQDVVDETTWHQVISVIKKTLDTLRKFRADEGKALAQDFGLRITHIQDYLQQIAPFEKKRIEKLQKRLRQTIDDSIAKDAVDENRYEQEVLYFLEKMDITEEKVRLTQHCKYFLQELNSKKEAKGKKLNFICQEIGREINTIGSKANSSDIQRLVVQMKDELEKIKEQISNIL